MAKARAKAPAPEAPEASAAVAPQPSPQEYARACFQEAIESMRRGIAAAAPLDVVIDNQPAEGMLERMMSAAWNAKKKG